MHVGGHDHARVGLSEPLRRIRIIGGTGDLSRRHLLPALTRLLANGELPEGLSVTLTGLEPMPVESCRQLIAQELAAHASDLPSDARQSLTERISYLQADVRNADALRPITTEEPSLIYVATPPAAAPSALDAVSHAGLHRSARIVLDKPFGLSRSSAQALNAQVLGLVAESQVYRIDHFLYHRTVQELVRRRVESDPLTLADRLPLAEVEIRWDETRTTPADAVGVMEDMIQSHLLQLAAVITMDAPNSITRADFARNRLEALRHMASREAASQQSSATLVVRSEMPRWREVPFVLRAAKDAEASHRHVEFRLATPGFVRLEVLAGKLAIMPAGAEAPLEVSISADTESASTRLLRAALVGDDTFTLSPHEPEEAWRIVEHEADA
jgi:glucose-6-phosphate 1-dehydrogenase